jgi:hypothetical protein
VKVVDAHALALAPTTIQSGMPTRRARDACICGILSELDVCTMRVCVVCLCVCCSDDEASSSSDCGESHIVLPLSWDRVTFSIRDVPHRTHTAGKAYQAWAGAEIVKEYALRVPQGQRHESPYQSKYLPIFNAVRLLSKLISALTPVGVAEGGRECGRKLLIVGEGVWERRG